MAARSFQFKQFAVAQDRCAMKVGTDGTLLGAWAEVPADISAPAILDIGTGTGLVAMMMAQRWPQARVMAIDIDPDAASQARQNVAASRFADRIEVAACDLQTFQPAVLFDAIVCNPPFFVDALTCPDTRRTLARHTASLPYEDLMKGAFRLLAHGGKVSVVVPADYEKTVTDEGLFAGLMAERVCRVRTKEDKPPKRVLMTFTNVALSRPVIPTELTIDSEAYRQLLADFYL